MSRHLRKPVGFPVDLTSGMASVAIASGTDVDSIAFGMVMESLQRPVMLNLGITLNHFHYKSWAPLFDSTKIPLYLPVAGISGLGLQLLFLTQNSMESLDHASEANGRNGVTIVGNVSGKHWLTIRF